MQKPPEAGGWDRLLTFAADNPAGFFVVSIGLCAVLYFLPAVLRAWRGKNGHRAGSTGETGEMPALRDERRKPPAEETDRMLIELRAHMDAQHEAFCDRLSALEAAINGADGLQVQVSRAADDVAETKQLVMALPAQLAKLVDASVDDSVRAARRALAGGIRDVVREGDRLLAAATGADVDQLRRDLRLRQKPIGEAEAT